MNSYTQALQEMASVKAEKDVDPQLSVQSNLSFDSLSVPNNRNPFDGSASSFESNPVYTDTSMDAYVEAINRSNGNDTDPTNI
jgi:hypothetical protein